MAIGYASYLKDKGEVTFREFTMHCARAFGAPVEMRGDSLNASILDEFRPTNYHSNAIEETKKLLAEVEKWSNTRAEREAKKAFDEEVLLIKERFEEDKRGRRAYTAMLKQVGKWIPPSKDHEDLKYFMIEELVESIELSCLHTLIIPQQLSGKKFQSQLIKNLRCDIEYHTKEYEKEVRCARKRSEWVRSLWHSLECTK